MKMGFSAVPQARNLGLVMLLLLLCLYTALASLFACAKADGSYTTISLTSAHYIGFITVASCLASYLWLRPYFRYTLGITLLLSLFNLAVFLPSVLYIGLSFGEVGVKINPFSLLLLIAYYFLNRSGVHTFIRKYLLPVPAPAVLARQHRESIDQFKETFKRKSNESLQQMLADNKLVPNALVAARELLEERGKLSHQSLS
jgi:hypothetical protein